MVLHPDKSGYGEISSTSMMRRIGLPDAPMILEIFLSDDVADAPLRIPASRVASNQTMQNLLSEFYGCDVIVVCQKGRKLDHGTAALLSSNGISTEVLSGGMGAWLSSDDPRIPIDQVMAAADRFGATPFDVPEPTLTHRADLCTFDVMLHHFGLTTVPLEKMADAIRAADLGRFADAPQAAGFLAFSAGLSRMYKNNTTQLEAALVPYDALYRWASDGEDETHQSAFGAAL